MARRVLVPVMPSERFYDAVVAAADLVASEGGIITFLFTNVRPSPAAVEAHPSQTESEVEMTPDVGDEEEVEAWQDDMVQALADARDLLYERGIEDEQVNYLFGSDEESPARVIADEAASGAYDLVVLARGYFVQLPDLPGAGSVDVASAVQELADEGVQLLVT